ncbi:MAG: hypothetical protein KF686_19155 [Ramlibacter sp.]|nr:hypothetical protein [Ramlibacter sp.]MBX3660276.1 hypothetical protein [Ramlibacter sp.]
MSSLQRRQFTGGLGLALALGARSSPARESALPVPVALRIEGRRAVQGGNPLVLLATLPGCPYCELVRRNYLLPMRAEGLAAWQFDVTDRKTAILDFRGEASHGAALSARWKTSFTPTVLFLGAEGEELAERLVGVAVPDFYGAYLDTALATARRSLAQAPRNEPTSGPQRPS